jgi:hypothetical protein
MVRQIVLECDPSALKHLNTIHIGDRSNIKWILRDFATTTMYVPVPERRKDWEGGVFLKLDLRIVCRRVL